MTNGDSLKGIKEQISKMLASERTVHAFLFVGGSPESRESVGMYLAEQVLCTDELSRRKFLHGNCEDFLIVEKPADRESIVKDQILELNEKLAFKPFGDRYAILIRDAHLMNQIAQNKLLKGLEEPESPAVFILLAERQDALLPTIRSRCTLFSLGEENADYPEAILSAATSFAVLIKAGPCYYNKRNAISFILNDKDTIKNNALQFLDALEDVLSAEIKNGGGITADAVRQIEKARMYIIQGQSPAYTLKQFCLKV